MLLSFLNPLPFLTKQFYKVIVLTLSLHENISPKEQKFKLSDKKLFFYNFAPWSFLIHYFSNENLFTVKILVILTRKTLIYISRYVPMRSSPFNICFTLIKHCLKTNKSIFVYYNPCCTFLPKKRHKSMKKQSTCSIFLLKLSQRFLA